jgi:hypothetical protein
LKTLLLSILLLSVGCVATEQQEGERKYFFLPFPCDEFPNVAQKDPSPKDWGEDFCGG